LILWHVWWLELQLGRTAALISRLKVHLEKLGLSQVTLSKELGVSPANLSEILRGNNSPNSETTLHMLEILESKSMATPVFTPKPDRPARVDNVDSPRTLAAAKDRIDELNAELRLLRSVPGKAAAGAPTRPALPTTTTSPAATSPTAMIVNPRPTPTTEIEKLRSRLETAAPEQCDALYRRIKEAESDTAVRAYKRSRQ
jgi:transcriptional regulator with XRE-family HTH domain